MPSCKQSYGGFEHQTLNRNDIHVVSASPARASDRPPLSLPHRLTAGRMRQLGGRTANQRCAVCKARLWGESSDDSTTALSANTPGRSQKGCLVGRISGMSPNEPTKAASMTEGNCCQRKHNQTRCRTEVTGCLLLFIIIIITIWRCYICVYKCKKNCSLSTTYNGEMTHRKQQK